MVPHWQTDQNSSLSYRYGPPSKFIFSISLVKPFSAVLMLLMKCLRQKTIGPEILDKSPQYPSALQFSTVFHCSTYVLCVIFPHCPKSSLKFPIVPHRQTDQNSSLSYRYGPPSKFIFSISLLKPFSAVLTILMKCLKQKSTGPYYFP